MRFSVSAAAILALVSSVVAQTSDFNSIGKPTKDENVPAGSTYEVTWTTAEKYKSGTIKISLIGGKDQGSLTDAGTIASGIDNSLGSYQWAVDSSLGDKALYGLVMTLESDPSVLQYSMPFHIVSDGTNTNGSSITSSTGTKTVTLSSLSSTSSVTAGNLSTTASGAKTTMTTQVTAGGLPGITRTGSSSTSTPTTAASAGVRATAGSILGLAGLVVAALAL